ncbi:hypothetical protein [Leptolyngbya sp. 7M]|jgi:hypothetical protein|uniref:Uncharacterized protein n=1 Tax=Leptolyngbya sp. NK1-12 TaxID=2547451 RepID=A0AA97AKY4_9CYAN|nr:hypothetical protein [Leptolyngbya sp. 7M]MBF2048829.1 hypothetical protein [Elainella sp. C42_A2020_010]QYO64244.1 hypothetical protein JVX88_31710 [Leptolyngbya sp. 7M]RNJ70079.1 MAG: hypothetical protein EDM05_05120 [Leptolyngbya sp. IPPAS B-1204]WNZ24062.1 hypothetical protein HJG54_15130 [Leptolyngbya sp. NK1-12]
MRSRIQLAFVMLGAGAVVAAAGLPAMAQNTPITDEFGATGTSPNAAAWLEAINEQYGLPTETPITDAQGITTGTEVAVWAEAIRGEYGIPGEGVEAGTPVTDEFGATGTSPDSAAWYESMKETYGIGTGL